ncbi:MAG: hypothetical protein LQ341_007056 [Variospora aurantia]|nr:MAG: hypothetical protein LQ341_007056 [Variospora aurantia]
MASGGHPAEPFAAFEGPCDVPSNANVRDAVVRVVVQDQDANLVAISPRVRTHIAQVSSYVGKSGVQPEIWWCPGSTIQYYSVG